MNIGQLGRDMPSLCAEQCRPIRWHLSIRNLRTEHVIARPYLLVHESDSRIEKIIDKEFSWLMIIIISNYYDSYILKYLLIKFQLFSFLELDLQLHSCF